MIIYGLISLAMVVFAIAHIFVGITGLTAKSTVTAWQRLEIIGLAMVGCTVSYGYFIWNAQLGAESGDEAGINAVVSGTLVLVFYLAAKFMKSAFRLPYIVIALIYFLIATGFLAV